MRLTLLYAMASVLLLQASTKGQDASPDGVWPSGSEVDRSELAHPPAGFMLPPLGEMENIEAEELAGDSRDDGALGRPERKRGRGGPANRSPGYGATWYPATSVAHQDADFGFVHQSLSVGAPVWHNDVDTVIMTAGVSQSLFSTDVVLPDTGRPFPDELWNMNVGINHVHRFRNDWTGSAMVSLGSASDEPFHSIHEMRFRILGFLEVPARNARDAWQYSIMYAPFSDLDFPVPGLAYAWYPSDELQMNIGVPFSVTWQPWDDLVVNASYFPLLNVTAMVTYEWTEVIQLLGGYETDRETYLLADRANHDDQFLASQQRVIGGVRVKLWRHAALDVNAGYVFDRYYGEGGNRRDELHDRVEIAPGPFLGSRLLIIF